MISVRNTRPAHVAGIAPGKTALVPKNHPRYQRMLDVGYLVPVTEEELAQAKLDAQLPPTAGDMDMVKEELATMNARLELLENQNASLRAELASLLASLGSATESPAKPVSPSESADGDGVSAPAETQPAAMPTEAAPQADRPAGKSKNKG